jgi:hypothetical protein
MEPSQRETEDLRPVPGGKPGAYWSAMRLALVVVVVLIIVLFVWIALSH